MPLFSEQSRLAATAARRERAAVKMETWDKHQVFVITAPDPGRYSWQIRKFGAIVVETSIADFGSQADARVAGEGVLASGAGPV